MKDVLICGPVDAAVERVKTNPADRLIRETFAAQSRLVGKGEVQMIPAVAEAPIPVLARNNRTPDPAATGADRNGKAA
ncbi:hypothetical protein RGQ15_02180 [Paracoccus sp. MBLB3053]|uniref:Uncharacterized protein n=1 Tax=Paracoccus aurantius TaxID=3073814 RepID=A0ABU2HNP0_9RHOB|nr:hypothetical protein [Paracoccus sp. MBLB3053]MDS9466382.1 hypothetical protein [Paracoccus sp. MBLB3053]